MYKLILSLAFMLCTVLVGYAQGVESFSVKDAEGMLHAELQKPEISPLVIICHAFNGNCNAKLLTDKADDLLKDGIASIRFDFNGHGKNIPVIERALRKNVNRDQ